MIIMICNNNICVIIIIVYGNDNVFCNDNVA